MDIQQLRCFLMVAEELHFGRAAERLHLTVSPVSRAVRDLERELGADLFIRRYHQVELTSAGRLLVERAAPVVADFDRIKTDIRAEAAGSGRIVHLGGTHMAPPSILDDVVSCVEKACAGHPLDVTLAPSVELLEELQRGELDAAVVHLPVDRHNLDSFPLASYRFHVAMRTDDPLAERAELTLADLADRTVATLAPDPQPVAMHGLRRQLESRGVIKLRELSTDVLMLAAHVRRADAVALTIAPDAGGASAVFADPAFVVRPLAEPLDFHLGLAWRRREHPDAVVGTLVEAIREQWGGTEIQV